MIKQCESTAMTSPTCDQYNHKEDDKYFSNAFSVFSELRKTNTMTDIILTTSILKQQPCKVDDDYCTGSTMQKGMNEKVKLL